MLLWSSAALADPRRSETFIAGKAGKLQAFVWRPSGAGPFPALVYNHGSERDPVIGTESAIGPYFADNGWVVIFPIRRGAGRSEGAYWGERVRRQPAAEKDRAVVDALVTDADDVAAAVDWLRAQKFVDHDNISVAGCSFGGIESLLSAERPLRLRAVIDFVGASLSWAGNAPLCERMT